MIEGNYKDTIPECQNTKERECKGEICCIPKAKTDEKAQKFLSYSKSGQIVENYDTICDILSKASLSFVLHYAP